MKINNRNESTLLKNTDIFLLKNSSCSARQPHKFLQKSTFISIFASFIVFAIFSFIQPAFAATAPSTLTNGLVGYWTFSEGQGMVAKNSLDANNFGSLINGPTWTNGVVNGALVFNGVNNYVVAPDSSNFRPAKITVSAWINIASTSGYIVLKSKGIGASYELDNSVHSSNSLEFCTYNAAGSVSNCAKTSNASYLNNWVFVTGQYDGVNLLLWVNGVKMNSKSAPAINYTDPLSLYIGGYNTPNTSVSGAIGDVRVYNRVITPAEITQLYGLGKVAATNSNTSASHGSANSNNTNNNNALGNYANTVPFSTASPNPATGVNVSGSNGSANTNIAAPAAAAEPQSTGAYSGLVKCTGVLPIPNPNHEVLCSFNMAVTAIADLINWLFLISVPIAVALFAYAGVLYITGMEKNITKAHGIFQKTMIGFIIMLVAFTVVHTLILWFANPGIGAETFLNH